MTTAEEAGTFVIGAQEGRARAAVLHTRHGSFNTPAFMPVGTQATVKGALPRDLREMGAEILLTNTYHLHLRPGDELIRKLGGIHRFMSWDGPILSDSGGFQVYSLSKIRKVTDESVVFNSHIDGARVELTPEKVIRIQENLGVDIMMVLDECLPSGTGKDEAAFSWERTAAWARRSLAARQEKASLLFGIAQGGHYTDLRKRSCEELAALGFDGYAIGGVSVGESTAVIREMTDVCTSHLPLERPRYLMGVGTPLDLVESVALGVDMFDCIIPTRSARFGRIYRQQDFINLKNTAFRTDPTPLEEGCDCYACANFSKAYISHLLHAKEILAVQLATLHNLRFYQRLMQTMRFELQRGTFGRFAANFVSNWKTNECSAVV